MTRYTATVFVSAPGNVAFPCFSGLTSASAAEGITAILDTLLVTMDEEGKQSFLTSCQEAVIELTTENSKTKAKATLAKKSIAYSLEVKVDNAKGASSIAKASGKAIGELTLLVGQFKRKFDKWLFDSRKKWRAF